MLNLFNTLTQKDEPFKPAENMHVKIYTCGPSTYQPAHIGNYRTFLFEDILQRYMEYLGYNVKRLMTLTDVEDKAIDQARKESLTVEELTRKNEAVFFKDFDLLKIKRPDYPVRASKAVEQAVYLISQLMDAGYAYFHKCNGVQNAYFDPLKFKGFGKLAHLDMSKWPKKKRRFHKDTYPGTPWNKGDFVIWHGCQKGDVCYETAIGNGRPSWNIQDAAIVTKQLGFTVDVGCGGIDNLVRHHDYTLAVAEAVSGKQFSRYWLHGGHLLVEGKKMSKSKGNVYYPSEFLAKGFSGSQLRFFLIYGHYRKKLNFTFDKFVQTTQKLNSLKNIVSELQNVKSFNHTQNQERLISKIIPVFESHMNNDIDVKSAFDSLTVTIMKIYEKRTTLSSENIKNLMIELKKVDIVLQCIF